MVEKKPIDNKSIARRKGRWEKCVCGASGGSGDTPFLTSVHCCTNNNVGQRWRLEKWQEYVKDEGSSYGKYINLNHQAYARFGTTDVYILRPEANFVECEKCPEYKPKKSLLSYW